MDTSEREKQSSLRDGLKLAIAAIDRWEESTDDPAPAWCVTNAFLFAIEAEEGTSLKTILAELTQPQEDSDP